MNKVFDHYTSLNVIDYRLALPPLILVNRWQGACSPSPRVWWRPYPSSCPASRRREPRAPCTQSTLVRHSQLQSASVNFSQLQFASVSISQLKSTPVSSIQLRSAPVYSSQLQSAPVSSSQFQSTLVSSIQHRSAPVYSSQLQSNIQNSTISKIFATNSIFEGIKMIWIQSEHFWFDFMYSLRTFPKGYTVGMT